MGAGVTILVPAMRSWRVPELVENIRATTPEPHRIYVATSDGALCDELDALQVSYLHDEGDSWGRRLNTLYKLTYESYMFLAADDVRFHEGWLTAALGCMAASFDSVGGVVAVRDGYNPQGTLALVSRAYVDLLSGCADARGVIIHPGYHHAYSETELFNTARSRRRFAYCADSFVEHLYWHPSNIAPGRLAYDETYALGDSWVEEDRALHLSRGHLWR